MDKMEAAIELLERAIEQVVPEDLVMRRDAWYVFAALLSWGYFWDLAERHQGNNGAHIMTWGFVIIAWVVVALV